ncbi:kelch domain-containing protein 7A [Elgaria multicarinata webbii]|uniref:kelch domain-containing protein 7A n=1 Tax=Elgaria multicarinata webbii TaxID=159646 RepID=UPI002FCD163F
MIAGVEVSGERQPSDMQLAGRLALSAAALLLLTLAYRYYKSRASASSTRGGACGRAGVGQDAGQKEPLACGGTEREDTSAELRHRNVKKKGTELNGRASDPPVQVSGPAAAGVSGLQGTPVGRERKERKEEEVKEEEQKKEALNHLGIGLRSDGQGLAPAEKGEETSQAVLGDGDSVRATGGTAAAGSGSRPSSPGLLSQGEDCCSSNGDHEGASWDAECGRAEFRLAAQDQQARRGRRPGSDNGFALERRESRPPGEDDTSGCLAQRQGTQVGQEKTQSFHATSNVGVLMSQSNRQSYATCTFSSVAKVQVEEKLLQERGSKDGQPDSLGTNLRGKVYDYYVQSISQSVMKENPSYASPPTQLSYNLSAIGMPGDDSEEQLDQEPSATEMEENQTAPTEVPAPSSEALLSPTQDDAKPVQMQDQNQAGTGGNQAQKPPGARFGFTRKESFHKIVENPELQMPMEGFASPASGSASRDTPGLSPLRSSSVSSLVVSLQSRPSDASKEPTVELVAGAKFFHIPLSPASSIDVRLDLGNCYEALCTAKKQKLDSLREAAYKVMSDNYLQVLKTHAIYGRLNAMERDLILQRRMRGRKYVTVADVSSQAHTPPANQLCYYDDQKDTWHPLTHLPLEAASRGSAMCSMFNYLFVVAGCAGRGKDQRASNRVFCYNPLTNIWQEIRPLNQARPHCKLVALDGYLYAIGGECLYTVERYDPRLDRWTFAAPLPNDTFAVAHTATACDGEIYVTGGTLRYILMRYVARSDTWKVSLTGGSKDRTTEMVTTNGFIYRFDLNRSMGISVYRCSARAKLWYECATHPLPFPACFQCAVVDNLIYCISRQFNFRFLADHISPRFGSKELQNFPSPRGTLFPITLILPNREAVQTRV